MNHETEIITGWKPPRYIITGEQGEGKTTLLLRILAELTKQNVNIGGIATPGYFKDGIRSGFDVLDVRSGTSEKLCTTNPTENSLLYGRYYFRPEGLLFGTDALNRSFLQEKVDLLVIDEVGKFELSGKVWGESIDLIMKNPYLPMIWTVRRPFVEEITKKWPMSRQNVIAVGSEDHEQIIHDMMADIQRYRSETTL